MYTTGCLDAILSLFVGLGGGFFRIKNTNNGFVYIMLPIFVKEVQLKNYGLRKKHPNGGCNRYPRSRPFLFIKDN